MGKNGVKGGPFSRGTIGGGTRGSPALWHRRARNRRFPVPLQLRAASRLPQTGRDPGVATSFASSPQTALFLLRIPSRKYPSPPGKWLLPFQTCNRIWYACILLPPPPSPFPPPTDRSMGGGNGLFIGVSPRKTLLFPAFGKLLITLLEVVGPISMRRSPPSVKRFHRVAHLGGIKSGTDKGGGGGGEKWKKRWETRGRADGLIDIQREIKVWCIAAVNVGTRMQLASMTDAAVVGNDLWILWPKKISGWICPVGSVWTNLFEIYLGKLSSINLAIINRINSLTDYSPICSIQVWYFFIFPKK